MTRFGYAILFALAVLSLTLGSLLAFRHLDSLARAEREAAALTNWPMDSVPTQKPFTPIAAGPTEYAKYAAEDAEWRKRNARQYTLSELRARGDGRRTAREAMQDRVYEYKRSGNRTRAIAELESWIRKNPRDQAAILSLARLLNESGRSNEAIARYRQLLGEAGGRQ
jgi:tetratricopeptide (TPR) repeat protein